MTTTQIAGLKVGDKIPAPMPFDGIVEIIGFRYRTSRHTGATYMVADYVGTRPDGSTFQSFDDVKKLVAHVQTPEAVANARLIAAAPELLAALRQAHIDLFELLPPTPERHAAIARVQVAIAKTEGTAP